MKDAFDYIKIEYLENEQRKIAEVIGIEAYGKLCKFCGGTAPYIAMHDAVIAKCRKKAIQDNAKTASIDELSQAFGISQKQCEKLVLGLK